MEQGAPTRSRTWWRRFAPGLVTFVLLAAVQCCWALALPRNAGPDEPSHDRKAAAVVRGQLRGPHVVGYPDGMRQVLVPGELAGRFYPCFAFAPRTTAACQERVHSGGVQGQGTTAGKYPPLPYVPAGLAGFARSGYRLAYAMRIGQALATAALVAWAAQVLFRVRRGALARAGLLFALTPTAVFVSSVVNPNGIEAAASVLAWAAGLVLAFDDGPPRRADVVAFATGASVMTLTRTLSPVWLGVMLGVLVIVAPRARRAALLGDTDVRWCGLGLVVAVAGQVGWIVWSGLAHAVDPAVAQHYSTAELARILVGRPWLLYRQLVGQFGWYEVNAPPLTIVAWTTALGLFVGGALLVARRRVVLAVLAVVGVTVVVPALVDGVEASRAGLVWQGRYSLPLVGGLTILAGFELGRSRMPADVERRLLALVGAAFAVAHVSGFVWALRRYMVGIDGRVWFWSGAGWRPPVSVAALLVVQPLAVVALAWYTLRTPGRATPVDHRRHDPYLTMAAIDPSDDRRQELAMNEIVP